ncbi:ribosome small subunit-dependent GTPase A [Chachezhania sediminis]|uniref:ribosome small subunit-dependent GTPase A n=1 Tax=Chachezhania sediminis TaxID=2599291 RepID=UPI00131C541F|nr:ribosome small subunit-dependent GTPase A [Chachezhania sediminis]
MTHPSYTLPDLGWSAQFQSQLSLADFETLRPARIAAVHRSRLEGLSADGPVDLTLPPDLPAGDTAVGDWVLYAPDTGRMSRVLDRTSLLKRRAAGTGAVDQLIAANVDTLLIVTSANADFNPARLERYLALAHAAGAQPLIVVTKSDLCADPDLVQDALRKVARTVPHVALDARDPAAAGALADWCGKGQTLACVGSSGVGKSTLVGTLTGQALATQGIREDDAKGRHTTTSRALYRLPAGGWLIDTPGMRALRLTGVEDGIDQVFDDIADLAAQCRFGDCTHETEPGCAVQAAIADGNLSPDRLARWQKLRREDRHNSETIAQARARGRAFGKMVRQVTREKKDRR